MKKKMIPTDISSIEGGLQASMEITEQSDQSFLVNNRTIVDDSAPKKDKDEVYLAAIDRSITEGRALLKLF